MDDRWLDPDEQATFRSFVRAARALLVQFDRDLRREVGLPRAYFEILWLLDHGPVRGLRMSDIAEATGSQPSRITHAVSRLEAAGHVRRVLCREDRRGWYAVLTDEGRAMLERAAPCYARHIRARFIEPLSPAARAELTAIGETLLAELRAAEAAGDGEVAAEAAEAGAR